MTPEQARQILYIAAAQKVAGVTVDAVANANDQQAIHMATYVVGQVKGLPADLLPLQVHPPQRDPGMPVSDPQNLLRGVDPNTALMNSIPRPPAGMGDMLAAAVNPRTLESQRVGANGIQMGQQVGPSGLQNPPVTSPFVQPGQDFGPGGPPPGTRFGPETPIIPSVGGGTRPPLYPGIDPVALAQAQSRVAGTSAMPGASGMGMTTTTDQLAGGAPSAQPQFSPYDDVFRKYAGDLANDSRFIQIIAAATKQESTGGTGWNPAAINDSNGEYSVGLFQMNKKGGAGGNYPDEKLQDPDFAASVMVPQYAQVYRQVTQANPTLDGAALASQVARLVERPAGWKQEGGFADKAYQAAFNSLGAGGVGAHGSSGEPAPATWPEDLKHVWADFAASPTPDKATQLATFLMQDGMQRIADYGPDDVMGKDMVEKATTIGMKAMEQAESTRQFDVSQGRQASQFAQTQGLAQDQFKWQKDQAELAIQQEQIKLRQAMQQNWLSQFGGSFLTPGQTTVAGSNIQSAQAPTADMLMAAGFGPPPMPTMPLPPTPVAA